MVMRVDPAITAFLAPVVSFLVIGFLIWLRHRITETMDVNRKATHEELYAQTVQLDRIEGLQRETNGRVSNLEQRTAWLEGREGKALGSTPHVPEVAPHA